MFEKFFWSKPSFRFIVLAGAVLIYTCSQAVRWNYASITPYLVTDFGIGKPELGLLGSAFFYAYAATQIPWGVAHDKLGGRSVLPAGFIIVSLFLAGFATAATFTQAMGWRVAIGFAAASGFAPANALLSKWFEKRERGFALGIYSSLGGGLGEAMSFVLMPLIALLLSDGRTIFGYDSWRGSTIIMAGTILVMSLIAAFLLRSDPKDMGLESIAAKEEKAAVPYKQAVWVAIKDPSFYLITMCFSAFTVGCRLLPAWLPMYGTAMYLQTTDMSKAEAVLAGSIGVTMYIAGRLIGTPIVGKVSDYLLAKYNFSRNSMVAWIMALSVVMFYAFTLPMPSVTLFAVLSFIGGVLVTAFPIINAMCAEAWSIGAAGFNNALMNTFGQIIAATVLAMSGFWAVKYSVKGGGYWMEFAGIWYLGILVFSLAFIAAMITVYREKQHRKASKVEYPEPEAI